MIVLIPIQLETFFQIYKLTILDCMNDNNKYNITIDYNDNELCFIMCNRNTLEVILSKRINIGLIESRNFIDKIRSDFIANHHISSPEINMYDIKLPSINCSYIMCHHIQNTKFDLMVTIRNENDKVRAKISQQMAIEKINFETYQKKLET